MSVEYKGKIFQVKKKEGLITLNLSNREISDITEIKGLEFLTDLQVLKLFDNKITEIKGLHDLKSLKKLDLSHNEIIKIEGLTNLINLEELDLGYNIIESIEGIDNLGKISRLNLVNNNISHIINFKNKDNLKNFTLYRNPLYDTVKKTFGSVSYQKVVEYTQISEQEKNLKEQQTTKTQLKKERDEFEKSQKQRKIDIWTIIALLSLGIIFTIIGFITLDSQGFTTLTLILLVIGGIPIIIAIIIAVINRNTY